MYNCSIEVMYGILLLLSYAISTHFILPIFMETELKPHSFQHWVTPWKLCHVCQYNGLKEALMALSLQWKG